MRNSLVLFLAIAAGVAQARPAAICIDRRDFSIHDFSLKFSDPDAQGVRMANVGEHIFKEWIENGQLKGSWTLSSPSAQCWIYDRAMPSADDSPDQLDDQRIEALGGPWDLRDISQTENFAANLQLFRMFFELQGPRGELLRQQWILLHHMGFRLSGLLTLRVLRGQDFDLVQFSLPMRKSAEQEAAVEIEVLEVIGRVLRTNGRISGFTLDNSSPKSAPTHPEVRGRPLDRRQLQSPSPGRQFLAPLPPPPPQALPAAPLPYRDPIGSLPGHGGTNTSGGR